MGCDDRWGCDSAAGRHPGVRACIAERSDRFCVAIAVREVVQVYVEHPCDDAII